jgi:hypothetical protein
MVADHQGGRYQGAVNHEIGCALCILQSRIEDAGLDFGNFRAAKRDLPN